MHKEILSHQLNQTIMDIISHTLQTIMDIVYHLTHQTIMDIVFHPVHQTLMVDIPCSQHTTATITSRRTRLLCPIHSTVGTLHTPIFPTVHPFKTATSSTHQPMDSRKGKPQCSSKDNGSKDNGSKDNGSKDKRNKDQGKRQSCCRKNDNGDSMMKGKGKKVEVVKRRR
jgi:hypothetical protein